MATKEEVIKQFDGTVVVGGPTGTTKIMAALLKAQRAITPVTTDGTNPHFKSKYATLSAVLDTCLTPLHDAGVVPVQEPTPQGLRTTLVHAASGEFIESLVPIPMLDNPQKYGSWLTYAKRYALVSMLCIPQEDDDGERAVKPGRTPTTKTPVNVPSRAEVENMRRKIDGATRGQLERSEAAFEAGIDNWFEEGKLRMREYRIKRMESPEAN